jgi:outer membrane protein
VASRISRRWVLIVMLSLFSFQASAATLDFRQCVEAALAQNPDLAVSRSQIEQAEAAVRQAAGNHWPRLNLSLTATRTDDALNAFGLKLSQRNATFGDFGAGEFNPSNPNVLSVAPHDLNHPGAVTNYNPRIELLIPVYNGGLVKAYVEQARASVRAAQSGDQMARRRVVKQVLMAYQGVHTARAFIKVTEEGSLAAEEFVRVTGQLLKQGLAVKSDLLSAQVNLDDVKLKQVTARNAESAALDQLHLLMGKPLDEPLDVGPPVMPAPLEGDSASLRRQALADNQGLQAMRHQLDAAGAAIGAAGAAGWPQFNVMLRRDYNDKDPSFSASSYTVAGMISWTAFDGGVVHAARDRAEAQRIELRAKLRQAEEGVGYQVSEAWRRAREAEIGIDARTLSVEQAVEAQRLVKRRYENGIATLVELLAVQARLDKTRADLVAAQYELAVQRAELKLALGVLDANQL